jgi:photosystem II stability/assembly factor-like uncharacterized protein
MMKTIVVIVISIFVSCFTLAQTWQLLPNSPSAGFRHDDLFFINADTGWVVNVDGYIYKTTDGGNSFITQLYKPATSFRCVGFANELKGWAGNLGTGSWSPTTDTLPLYETVDGGTSWQAVTNITGPLPRGICGISVVNDTVVYAVGRVEGPCYIMKTINGGGSWLSVDFDPPAHFLIDCKFFSPDTGLVVGCTGTNMNDEKYAVWYTTNGGVNWQLVYHDSTSFIGHCWKINFPSRNTGYVSVESGCNNCDTIPVLKTTDGGVTWQKKIWNTTFTTNFAYEQGIGFINDSTGWCGDFVNQVTGTTDGGNSWQPVSFVANFNRLRKINDTLAYASGNRIWKYSNQTVSIGEQEKSMEVILDQNYPNPFSEKTSIKYFLPSGGHVILKVYDLAGRPVATLVNTYQGQGEHQIDLKLPYFYDTCFYYTLNYEDVFITRKALMIKNKR